MAAACALAIFIVMIILLFGTPDALRAFRCPLFTGGVTEGNSCPIAGNLHILCYGTLSKKEPSPWPVTVLSF